MTIRNFARQMFYDFRSRKKIFTHIYRHNLFGGNESVSGPGSTLEETAAIRKALPELLADLGIRTFVDAPCGDFYWMSTVDLGVAKYIGVDIVPELIRENTKRYGAENREFRVLDIVSDSLPAGDLIMARDCFIHLSNKHIKAALRNIRRAGLSYLLTTTFPHQATNTDIVTGRVRFINLQAPPFNFPEPLMMINENCTQGAGVFSDKSLALWRVKDITAR